MAVEELEVESLPDEARCVGDEIPALLVRRERRLGADDVKDGLGLDDELTDEGTVVAVVVEVEDYVHAQDLQPHPEGDDVAGVAGVDAVGDDLVVEVAVKAVEGENVASRRQRWLGGHCWCW